MGTSFGPGLGMVIGATITGQILEPSKKGFATTVIIIRTSFILGFIAAALAVGSVGSPKW